MALMAAAPVSSNIQHSNSNVHTFGGNGAPSSAGQVNNTYSNGSSGSNSLMDMLQADRAFSLASAREANAFNAAEAEKSRKWQEYMSNTAHQREVKDLIAAGLNPVLSANNGANAYSAAQASGVKADTPSGANALANIMAAAMTSSAMIQVAGINAASALKVTEQQGVNQIELSKENHKNGLWGSLWSLIDAVTKNPQSAKGLDYSTYLQKFKK